MEGKTLEVGLFTEPHLVQNKLHTFPRGTKSIFARNIEPNKPGPRAAIVAGRSVNLTALEQWCHRDCAVALTTINKQKVLIVSLYLDIQKTITPQWLQDLLRMAERQSYALIIGADTNAHSSLFGPDSNRRGDELEDLILHHGLATLNEGTAPTFEIKRGPNLIQTHIDATFVRGLHQPPTNWWVDRSYNASDHNTIRFQVNKTDLASPQKIRPWSKADWPVFRRSLATTQYWIPEIISMKKLDKMLQKLYDSIEDALNIACPKITISPTIQKNHWITEEHLQLKKKVGELYKKAKASNNEQDWDTYKRADKSFKRTCHKDKNKSWRKYKEGLETTKDTAALVKLAQRTERRDIDILRRSDGTSTEPGSDTIDLLTNTHFPAAQNTAHITYNNRKNAPATVISEKFKSWISPDLITRALLGFEKKKSPGPDDIKPLLFEHLPPEFISYLTLIYKSAMHLGYTPKLWKQTKVIFISKPGKDDYQNPKSFRPISLSNYLLKGLERLVGWKMDIALADHPIHPKQHGFTSGKATESAISNTTDYIERHIMQRQHCVGIFLDISAAFDSIRAGHVRQALLKHGGDPELVQWYYGYITHRDIIIDMHGHKSVFTTGVGFPQGGVCSAKFWLIAFDYAIQIINRYNIEGNGYADDCAALAGGPRLDHILKRLQKMLDELTAWGKTCGLSFNPDKSVAVLFTRRRKTAPFNLKIDGKEIPYQKQVKYLGITLDSKLYWTTHIDDKIKKTKKFLAQVAHITRNNWGPKPQLMRWAYLGVVRPMLCYGAMIWGHRAPEMIAKLRRINRMAINTFANFPKSTPTTALEIMLDITPLHLFCQQEGMAARARLHHITPLEWGGTNRNKTHCTSHLKHWKEKFGRHNLSFTNSDHCQMEAERKFHTNLDSFNGKSKHRTHTQFNIFTDGSKINGHTGAGFSIEHKGQELIHGKRKLPDHASVFQAEITAIQEACRSLIEAQNHPRPRFVKIFVDSQAAIRAVSKGTINSWAVLGAIAALNELAQITNRVTIVWIPAHKGHRGNERADTLAKSGAVSPVPSDWISTKKPKKTLVSEIRQAMTDEWNEEWTSQNVAHHSRGFYTRVDHTKAKYVYKLSRTELGRFVRIITGHNNLNFFQTKIGLWADPLCRFCGEGDETVTHLLTACPSLALSSRNILRNGTLYSDMRWSVRELLEFSYIPLVDIAFQGRDPDPGWNTPSPVGT